MKTHSFSLTHTHILCPALPVKAATLFINTVQWGMQLNIPFWLLRGGAVIRGSLNIPPCLTCLHQTGIMSNRPNFEHSSKLPVTRSCLPHAVVTQTRLTNAPGVDPTFSFIVGGITWPRSIYWRGSGCKCYHVQILHTQPPTSQEGQRQLCLNLYLPCSTCPKMLCCFVCTSF